MPQELHVLRCVFCEAFQVDVVKKIPKWSCKICGEKQSRKKIYGTGSGQECRLLVQSLNKQRLTSLNIIDAVNPEIQGSEEFGTEVAEVPTVITAKTSKWVEFVGVEEPTTPNPVVSTNSKSDQFVYKNATEISKNTHKDNDGVKNDKSCEVANSYYDNIFGGDDESVDEILTL